MTDANGCGIKDSVLIDVLDTIPPTISCPKDIERILHQTDGIDTAANNQNTIIMDLGKPVVWDNCGVASITNDAPEKFRIGITEVIWTVTDFVGLTDTCMQIVTIKALPVIPKLFSPNGDGINDNFEIDGLKDFPKSQLNVYTRSGQLVYSSEDYKNEWDGRFMTSSWSHNQIVAPGVYYYILNLGGATQKLQGFVYIYY
jgi:gliding motility-associated-like protein